MPRVIEKEDCFNCSINGRLCDRALHKCGTCLEASEVCRGYPLNLRWRKGLTTKDKQKFRFKSRRRSSASVTSPPSVTLPPTPKVETVQWLPTPCSGSVETILEQSEPFPTISQLLPDSIIAEPLFFNDTIPDPDDLLSFTPCDIKPGKDASPESSGESSQTQSGEDVDDAVVRQPDLEWISRTPPICDSSFAVGPVRPLSLDIDPDLQEEPYTPWPAVDLWHEYRYFTKPAQLGSLLDLYNAELCAIPITHDVPANPFRCNNGHGQSKYQLHAVIAFSTQYLSHSEQVSPHDLMWLKDTATKQYSLARRGRQGHFRSSFLDTLLIICTLEHLHRAAGPWRGLLSDVMEIIESLGGVASMPKSTRQQAQLAMFLWWDVTLALLCRSRCVLPRQYYDFVMACEDETTEWDFFSLTGVPKSLFRTLVELVQLAHEKERTLTMTWATFNDAKVLEIEEDLRRAETHIPAAFDISDDDSIESVQQKLDSAACIQAWKFALLLYLERVFHWEREVGRQSARITALSRQTLSTARNCRAGHAIQKQVLLPVFIAGSEVDDSDSRQFVQQYCETWQAKTRYQLFRDSLGLLRTIWSRRDRCGGDANVWWGSVLPEMQQTAWLDGKVVPINFLLG
ncbi:hypothetical protein AC579_6824 [Pseudocercospora musae]|uniref:Zn(2)-C6 fungal-type domain-containing protein n=1 Tax=Pseudocercospora musae TaxID=113226 RepID=A0A139IQ23_9PEZI|nr:hypothetical protein AC579_6824 [Pseudocercospora musae]